MADDQLKVYVGQFQYYANTFHVTIVLQPSPPIVVTQKVGSPPLVTTYSLRRLLNLQPEYYEDTLEFEYQLRHFLHDPIVQMMLIVFDEWRKDEWTLYEYLLQRSS